MSAGRDFGWTLAIAAALTAWSMTDIAAPASAPPAVASSASRTLTAAYSRPPLMFEENEGQLEKRTKLLARGPGYLLLLEQREAILALERAPEPSRPGRSLGATRGGAVDVSMSRTLLHIRFSGASARTQVLGRGELPGKTNYLLGPDPSRWRREVPNYAAAEYHELYPGIGAVFHGSRGESGSERLELDFEVAAGADPSRVALELVGARKIERARDGDLVLKITDGEDVVLGKPRVYQEIAGQRRRVDAAFSLRSRHRVAFSLGRYDRAKPLIIDPTLQYSTYVAGGQVSGIAVDHAGHVYIVGTTSGGLATSPANAYESSCAACAFIGSAFVAKYDTTQSGAASLIYSTYLGPAGNAVMPDLLGSASGSAIAIDSNGDAYVTGQVQGSAGSSYFPTTSGAWLSAMPGGQDTFVSELDPTGTTLLASTYLGGANDGGRSFGSNTDQGTGIGLDRAGNVYVTGLTNSSGLATPNAPQTSLQSGFLSGTPFVAKLDPTLSHLGYFTYLLGSDTGSGLSDTARAIAVDGAGDAYVTGGTYVGACNDVSCTGGSGGVSLSPAVPGFQSSPGGMNQSGYVAKIDPSGTQLLYLTFLGGGTDDNSGTEMRAIALDAAGDAYVTGVTGETQLPTTGSVVGQRQTVCRTDPTTSATVCPASFVAGVNPGVSGAGSLLFLTYLGGVQTFGGAQTSASAIALDSSNDLFVAGTTSATDMPLPGTVNTPNGMQPSSTLPCATLLPECISPFLAELAPEATGVLYSGYLAGTGSGSEQDSVAGIALDTQGDVFMAGTEATNDFPVTDNAYDQAPPAFGGSSSYLAVVGGAQSSGGSVANFTVGGVPPALGGLGLPVVDLSANVGSSATTQLVMTNTGGAPLTITGISLFGASSTPWSILGVTCGGAAVSPSATAPVTVAAGESCAIDLQFAPTPSMGDGEFTEGIQILDSAGSSNDPAAAISGGGQALTLGGTATGPVASLSAVFSTGWDATGGQISSLVSFWPFVAGNPPNFQNLPPVDCSSWSCTGTGFPGNVAVVTVTNTGNAPLPVGPLVVTNAATGQAAPFALANFSCQQEPFSPTVPDIALPPGGQCQFAVEFNPTTAGIYHGDLSLAGSSLPIVGTATGGTTTVPAIVGLTLNAADIAVAEAGLLPYQAGLAASDAPPGQVVSQSPVAGTSAPTGSAVYPIVSNGTTIPVPNLLCSTYVDPNTGLAGPPTCDTLAQATAAITSAGLVVGAVSQQPSTTVPPGQVISQNPVAGTVVSFQSAVNLVLSSGPPLAPVPNVVGDMESAAATAITAAGFVVGTVESPAGNTATPGLVLSQSPAAAGLAPIGTAVNLVLGISVPDVTGQLLATGLFTLANGGLSIGSITEQVSDTVPQGDIISESPVAGSSVAAGTAINLLVSQGPAPVLTQVPNVLGQTQTAASASLSGAGLALGTVTQQPSATVPKGEVLSQSPSAGNSVVVGSAVNLILSSGPPMISIGLAGAPQFTLGLSGWTVTIPVQNNGNVTADAIEELSATLNGVVPISAMVSTLNGLSSAASGSLILVFPTTVSSGVLKLTGSYTAGTLSGNWSVSTRVAVPRVP